MQHVKLGVDNLYPKFHEVVIKNEKVPGVFMWNIKCFLKTGVPEPEVDKGRFHTQ